MWLRMEEADEAGVGVGGGVVVVVPFVVSGAPRRGSGSECCESWLRGRRAEVRLLLLLLLSLLLSLSSSFLALLFSLLFLLWNSPIDVLPV